MAALVSFYIQCHTAAMAFDGDVCDLYAAGRAPGMCEDLAHTCYPYERGTTVAVKSWHGQHCDDASDPMAKLVRKGGPAPTSVRYVAGLLRRCVGASGKSSKMLRDMICCNMLGGYAHSTVSADPQVHAALLAMDDATLTEHVIASKGTKDLHHMVAEYVCANTLANDALMWSVGPIAVRHAMSVARGSLRIYGKDTPPTPPSAFSAVMTLARALNVNAAVGVGSSGTRAVGLTAPRLADLTAAGFDEASARIVHRVFDATSNFTLKGMRTAMKALTPQHRDFLRDHVWRALQSCRLRSVPLCNAVHVAQRDAMERLKRPCAIYLPVCTTCATPRSPVLGMRSTRSSMGTSTELGSSVVHCNACGSASIVAVNMHGRQLTFLAKRFDKSANLNHVVALCCGCARATKYSVLHGIYPMCAACLARARLAMTSSTECVCGVDVPSTSAHWVTVSTRTGGLEVVHLCRQHAHFAPDRVVPKEALVRAVLSSRAPKASRASGARR